MCRLGMTKGFREVEEDVLRATVGCTLTPQGWKADHSTQGLPHLQQMGKGHGQTVGLGREQVAEFRRVGREISKGDARQRK